jgi:hypothetical protein
MVYGWRRIFKTSGSNWRETSMVDLRKGDIFVMYEPDGTPVEQKGEHKMYALSNAYYNEETRTFVIDMCSVKERSQNQNKGEN